MAQSMRGTRLQTGAVLVMSHVSWNGLAPPLPMAWQMRQSPAEPQPVLRPTQVEVCGLGSCHCCMRFLPGTLPLPTRTRPLSAEAQKSTYFFGSTTLPFQDFFVSPPTRARI